ncbi:MAG: phosphoribosylglycinamide formyltransferase [Bacteroidetes bacterium]|nr:MAG: phosphoribosylglycinamide formyltransferase [Bacteroidota bacterium]
MQFDYFCRMKKIAIFASGSGTNMERIASFFAENRNVEVSLVVCNNPMAGVIQRAERLGIPVEMIDRKSFYDTDSLTQKLKYFKIDLVVLAGFLWLVPNHLLKAFPDQIINIHPALLPSYGGKGMYGEKVHQAVIVANERFSGITIHYVNEQYDEGAVIFQQKIELAPDETPESLALRIHELEYRYFPQVIDRVLSDN